MIANGLSPLNPENPRDAALLAEPQLALESLTGLILIDEIQRLPDLFPLMRHLVDTHKEQRYLILGRLRSGSRRSHYWKTQRGSLLLGNTFGGRSRSFLAGAREKLGH